MICGNTTYIRPRRWIRNPHYRCPCILLYNNTPVPLENIKYDVAINGGLANVTLSQTYRNKEAVPINVEYNFPINEDVVFSKIEAIFQNRKVQG
jgi:LEA14-like dessication related protein